MNTNEVAEASNEAEDVSTTHVSENDIVKLIRNHVRSFIQRKLESKYGYVWVGGSKTGHPAHKGSEKPVSPGDYLECKKDIIDKTFLAVRGFKIRNRATAIRFLDYYASNIAPIQSADNCTAFLKYFDSDPTAPGQVKSIVLLTLASCMPWEKPDTAKSA